jgi:hypothetical protein
MFQLDWFALSIAIGFFISLVLREKNQKIADNNPVPYELAPLLSVGLYFIGRGGWSIGYILYYSLAS